MKHKRALAWLVPCIGALALFAAGAGLLYQHPGQPFEYTNHRGETVSINGQGLYYYDSVSSAAQQQANDLITVIVGLPLLIVSSLLSFRGSMRGRLLLTGTLGFFLYTYMSMCMLTAYNALFLVYVALFGLSLYAFILSMMSFDIEGLKAHFSERLPRRWIAGLLFVVGAFLGIAWLGRIGGPLLQGIDPALENTTTLVIQAMDLVLVVPLAFLAGVLLLRSNSWGYLLASVVLLKGVTLGLAVSTMSVNMALHGVGESLGIMVPFLFITAANLVMAVLLLRNVRPTRQIS